jgi:hypothetical protein
MKKVPEQFEKNGFTYKMLFKEGRIRIYEVILDGVRECYEVVRIKQKNNEGNFEKDPACEVYPSAFEWGVNGFTTTNYDRALELAKAMIKTDENEKESH